MRCGKKSRARLLCCGVILACGCCASSSQNLRTRTTSQPADANVLLWDTSFSQTKDGVWRQTVEQRTAIFTEEGIARLGDPRVRHDTARQKLAVTRAVTTMRDGTEVAIKPNSITETTPDALATTPAYADLRETVITQVGMEVGCLTDLTYRIDNQQQGGALDKAVPLHQLFPIAERVIRVEVPAASALGWACLGCQVEPRQKKSPGGVTHTFVWRALPGINLGEATGAVVNQPRLVFSTTGSWQKLAAGLKKRFGAATKPTKAVRVRAEALIKNLATREQRLGALWHFVTQDLATVHWPLVDFEMRPRPAAQILQSSYGHSLDKAVLLSSLLAAAKIKSRPLWVSQDSLFAESVPATAQFSAVWLAVKMGKQTLWLDPTTRRAGDGAAYLEGRWVFDLSTEMPTQVDLAGEGVDKNQSVLVSEMKMVPDGTLQADITVSLSGTYSPYAEINSERGGDKVARTVLADLGGSPWQNDCDDCAAELLHLDADLAAFTFATRGAAAQEGRAFEVPLPWAPRSNLAGLDFHRESRQTAMVLRSRGLETVTVTLTLPPGFELRSKLPAGKVENRVGSLVTKSRKRGKAISIERTLRLFQRIVAPADYPQLRALFVELTRRDHRGLLLFRPEKKPGS